MTKDTFLEILFVFLGLFSLYLRFCLTPWLRSKCCRQQTELSRGVRPIDADTLIWINEDRREMDLHRQLTNPNYPFADFTLNQSVTFPAASQSEQNVVRVDDLPPSYDDASLPPSYLELEEKSQLTPKTTSKWETLGIDQAHLTMWKSSFRSWQGWILDRHINSPVQLSKYLDSDNLSWLIIN